MEKEQNKLDKSSESELLNNEIQIIKMGISDLDKIKAFIIDQYKALECKDFFIIEDIDTELPIIFNNGIVIAIVKNNQILGLQAIDFSKNNSDNLKEVLNSVYDSDSEFYELGWTMIHVEYRKKCYAKRLLKRICSYLDSMTEYVLVATVHPMNDAAFKLYFDLGLRPTLQTKYYGYDRIFMVKEIYEEK